MLVANIRKIKTELYKESELSISIYHDRQTVTRKTSNEVSLINHPVDNQQEALQRQTSTC